MTTVNRIDQAMLLLKERLRRLQERASDTAAKPGSATRTDKADPLLPLRQLAARGSVTQGELRRALVRTLLTDSLGEELGGSLEFQALADQVVRIVEDSEAGRALLARALEELQ
jgi:hypothetical protein